MQPVPVGRALRTPRTPRGPGGASRTYLLSTVMSGNGNAAATAVSTERVTLATLAFLTSCATIGPRLPSSVVYWSDRLSVIFFFFLSK